MNQCVPSCDADDTIPTATKFPLLPNSNSIVAPQLPMLDYQVAELVRKNGQLSSWSKPSTKDTLESIVNQQTDKNNHENKLFSWLDPRLSMMAMDALVPNFLRKDQHMHQDFSVDVTSCGGVAIQEDVSKRAGVMARVPIAHELSGCKDLSVSGSATCHRHLSAGFNSASMGSPENTTSSGKQCTRTTVNDDQDSTRHHRSQSEARDEDSKTARIDRSSGSNKKNKAAAVHNQSERRRRDKINQRLKTLQKLVPFSSKTDKASMLDEVIQYMKQLQAQVQMMNWMKMYSSMMLPITMQQQQLKMSMMAHMGMDMGKNMGMSMGMGMGMGMNTLNIPGIPPILPPTSFMPMASWNACGGDGSQGAQSKDAYNSMAALYHHQLFHPPPSNSKS